MPLDKAGQPYEPMTEAQKAVHRRQVLDVGAFTRHRAAIELRQKQMAADPGRVYHAPEARVAPEPMAKSIGRRVNARRRKTL